MFFNLGPSQSTPSFFCLFLCISSIFMCLFLHTSLLCTSSIISRHLIILGSPCFHETISSCLSLHASGIVSRHSIILDSLCFYETCISQAFLYLSTLVRLTQGQHSVVSCKWLDDFLGDFLRPTVLMSFVKNDFFGKNFFSISAEMVYIDKTLTMFSYE